MRTLDKLIHRCTVREGDLAGNEVATEVTAWDIRIGTKCEHCDQPLANPIEVMAHVYEALTDD